MKFTDMNFDCLETVLEYLNLIDLLNVADSTKRLNKAAELVFAQKHGNKTVRILNAQISRHCGFEIGDKDIYINDLKTVLQLLRCFRPVIFKISFTEFNRNQFEIDEKIVTYINKYCADYLKELEIRQCGYEQSDLLHYLDRQFPKLTKFVNIDLEFNENSCLNRLFPKMRCLHIAHMFNLSFYNINTKHFPYLEELDICDFSREPFLRDEMLINLLQLNPQLRKLTVYSFGHNPILNTDLIRSAVDSLQNIENLSIHNLKPITFLDDSDNIIRMKNMKSFEIGFEDSDYWSYLPFSFENLESFRIYFPRAQFVNGSFNDQFFNFIDRHPSITNLLIDQIEEFGDVDWSRLAKSLPLLIVIDIYNCYISADEAIEIIAKIQTLKRFSFQLSDDYDSFCKNLDNNWEGTCEKDTYIVKLNRKM